MKDNDGGGSTVKIAAVVVTHKRLELLERALERLEEQSRSADVVVVVENASGAGAAERIRREHPAVDVVDLLENLGGAGGFAVGIRQALEVHGADLVWVMDDDTLPLPTALEELERAWEELGHPDVVASKVVWKDGRAHPMNTPRRRLRGGGDVKGCTPVRSASFVSILLDARSVRRHGLPQAAYFLWNDDFEYTARLLRTGKGWLCPASVVEHHTETYGDATTDPGGRFYYEVRNKLWLLKHSSALTPVERFLYAGYAAVRWAQTLLRAPGKRKLLLLALEGAWAGLTTRPAPTEELLPPVRDGGSR